MSTPAARGGAGAHLAALPTIDLGPWPQASRRQRLAFAQRVRTVCRDVGFMYLSGHGIPPVLCNGVLDAARSFFAKPPDEKIALHYRHGGWRRGYIPLLAESSDPAQAGDLKEAFDLALDSPLRPPHPGIEGGAIRNLWPDRDDGFRQAVEAYSTSATDVARKLFAVFACAFELSDDWFVDKLSAPIATMRLLRYPQQAAAADGPLGIGEHCDYEALTLLLQDEVGGLEVCMPDGRWITVPPMPGFLIFNVGEMLSQWTGGELKATTHRVTNRTGRDRYSVPMFFAPNPEVLLQPLVDSRAVPRATRPEPVCCGDYLSARLKQICPVQGAATASPGRTSLGKEQS